MAISQCSIIAIHLRTIRVNINSLSRMRQAAAREMGDLRGVEASIGFDTAFLAGSFRRCSSMITSAQADMPQKAAVVMAAA